MTDLPRRGLSESEARRYVGVSARQLAANWRPHLVSLMSGTRRIFDRLAVEALFESRLSLNALAANAAPVRTAKEQADLAALLRDCRAKERRHSAAP